MKNFQKLDIEGAILDEEQLKKHLEKMAMQHTLKSKANKNTYPVPQLVENYIKIKNVYKLLNEHIKLGINIHPAGEWILDNFYIIEEAVRQIEKEMTLKKYANFVGIQNGKYAGFARIYVLATEIVAYTDNKINEYGMRIVRIPEELCNTENDNREYIENHINEFERIDNTYIYL